MPRRLNEAPRPTLPMTNSAEPTKETEELRGVNKALAELTAKRNVHLCSIQVQLNHIWSREHHGWLSISRPCSFESVEPFPVWLKTTPGSCCSLPRCRTSPHTCVNSSAYFPRIHFGGDTLLKRGQNRHRTRSHCQWTQFG